MIALRYAAILLAIGFALAVPPARAAGVVQVLSDVSVEGSRITLGEIATLDGLAPDVAVRLGSLELGPAAPPGSHRTLPGVALRARLASLAPDAVLDVAAEVRVHTAYREILPALMQARLEQAIRHRMPWPEEALTLSDWKLPGAFRVPSSASRFLVHFDGDEDFLGRVTARIELVDPTAPPDAAPLPLRQERAASVFARVQLPVLVTTRALRRGEEVAADAIELRPERLAALPRDVLRDAEHAVGMRVARSVPAAVPLRAQYLESDRLVRRGDTLAVRVEHAGLALRVEARALENGHLGQSIRAENPSTRRRFLVEVTGPGQARLHVAGPVGAR